MILVKARSGFGGGKDDDDDNDGGGDEDDCLINHQLYQLEKFSIELVTQ